MENGVDTVEKHHPEESTSLPEDSLLSQSGDKHERKDSEADDVFEEAIDSNPDDAQAQMQQRRRPSNLDGSVVADGGEKLGKVQRAEDNGDCYENFEEAMDHPDEDQSHREEKMVAADVPDAVDGGEGDVEGIPAVIELNRSGIRAEEDGIEVEEKDGRCDGVFVIDKSENGDFCNVSPGEIGVEGGMVDEGKNSGGVQMVIESNGLEANGVAGKGERDGHGFLGDLVDHKEEKDATTDCVVSGEKSENGDFDKVDMNEALGVVLEKSENGDFDEVGTNEMLAAVLEKSENGDFDAVHAEEIEEILDQDESQKMGGASAYASVNEEKIPRQDESRQLEYALADVGASVDEENIPNREGSKKTEDALTVVGASFDEEKIPHEDESEQIKDASLVVGNSVNAEKITHGDESQQLEDALSVVGSSPDEENILYQEESQQTEDAMVDGNSVNDDVKPPRAENSPPLEVPVEMDDRLETETCNSEPQVSSDNQGIPSESSEVIDGNEELGRAEEPRKQDEGDKLSLGNESIAFELLERESVSVEEYDESSSTEEDDSELIMQPAQVVPSSAVNSVDLPPPSRPAGLGSSAPLLEPAPRALQQPRANGTTPQRQSQLVEDPANGEAEEYDETREKLQMIRVKFLRLAHRLGQTPHNVVVAQVLYRLGLAEQLRGSRNTSRAGAFSFDRASAMAEQLEAAGQEALDFSCTIMVLGKTGVGKSATINSIFDEVKFSTDAFQVGTTKVQDIVGMVQGIKVRVIDTPGLLSSCMDQRRNEKILHSVKRFIKKTPPDIVLYLDRLDMQSRDFGDVPLLRTITDIFGPSIWFNAIVVLTHAASAPPDGPNGTPLSYEMFVTQRSHVVQQAIRQAAGDVRLMNPVSLVENHSACRTNRAGQRVLPNGQVWKPQLLLLSFASKILAEANTLLKLQDSPPGKPFAARSRVPPLPFLLSSLLQSRPQLKLPEEQFGDEDAMDEDLDDASDSDDESEYDELPPFKRLTKAQLAKLSKAQKKAYFDELEYREKLFMKKQLKEEKMRRKLLKKMAASAKDLPNDYNENLEEESGGAASVPVPVPDMPLPASFDSDNPTHRYRYLDNSNQWLIRPVLDNHGWDHDVGYEGLNVERLFVVKDKIPVSFSGQVTKDKKECNLQMELASSIKHGEGKATSLGFDAQTIGKDMAYTLRSETRFINFTRNKMAAGLSFTMLGDALTAGLKLEDKLMIHKRFRLVMTGGAMTSRGDVAYGGSLEATLRDKDHPIGRTLSTLGLSIMDWHGDLAIGCNVQSQFPVGRTTNMITRANLNNRGSGQISIRLNSSEQLQIALIALIPVFRNIIKNRLFGSSQTM